MREKFNFITQEDKSKMRSATENNDLEYAKENVDKFLQEPPYWLASDMHSYLSRTGYWNATTMFLKGKIEESYIVTHNMDPFSRFFGQLKLIPKGDFTSKENKPYISGGSPSF